MTLKTDEMGAPDKLWLQLHGHDDGLLEPCKDLSDGISWHWEPVFNSDVEYIRADMYGWQPIETAPIDTEIMFKAEDGGGKDQTFIGQKSSKDGEWLVVCGWWGEVMHLPDCTPTGWMPKPTDQAPNS